MFRLNFSHGTHAEHAAPFDADARRRAAGRPPRRHPAGSVRPEDPHRPARRRQADPAPARRAADDRDRRRGGTAPGTSPPRMQPLAHGVQPGDRLLLDDGKSSWRGRVDRRTTITTTVIVGGDAGRAQGHQRARRAAAGRGADAKDERDLRFGLALGVDLVALSFVQSAADIAQRARRSTREGAPACRSSPSSSGPRRIDQLDEILDARRRA